MPEQLAPSAGTDDVTTMDGRYRALVESVSAVIFQTDSEGRWTYVNPAWTALTGYDVSETIGMRFIDLLHEEDRESCAAHFDALSRQEISSIAKEARYLTRSGETIWVLVDAHASFDDKGRMTGTSGTLNDITARKKAENRLETSRAQYQALSKLISSFAFSYLVRDDDTIELEWMTGSVQDVLGYTREEVAEMGWERIVHAEDVEVPGKNLKRVLGGESVSSEFRVIAHSQQIKVLRMYSFPHWDERRRRVIRISGAAQDITEQKKVERELINARDQAEELARMKSTFLANMSHEIRTPLTGILGFAAILAEEMPEEHSEFARLIDKSGRRLLETLNSVLDLVQLEASHQAAEIIRIDVVEQALEAVELLSPLAESKGLTVKMVPRVKSAFATLDVSYLRRIFNNLIGNAIKFTSEGTVSVEVDSDADKVFIKVQDTGIGISQTFMHHLFQEFKQESVGLARNYEGSGLGLAITKRLILLMGGLIDVESEKNIGSTFRVVLPRNARKPLHRPQPSQYSASTGARVLVVEDNSETQTFINHLLRSFNRLVIAGSPDEALTAAANEQFDLVLVDIHLGETRNGMDVLRQLREMPAYQHTPVIAMTAYALPGDREHFLATGFDDYLAKPFPREQLHSVIQKTLDRYPPPASSSD